MGRRYIHGFGWINRPDNPVYELWRKSKDAWCEKHFPEYAEIFEGYPPAIPRTYYDPFNPPRGLSVKGYTGAAEMTPWFGWDGSVDPRTSKEAVMMTTVEREKTSGLDPFKHVIMSEEKFQAWCDKINFFRNGGRTPLGGPGLNPIVFIGAFDIRTGSYWEEAAEYRRDETILVKPDVVTCETGIYRPTRGPSDRNPWGVNSSFTLFEHGFPSYVSDKWGPDHRPDTGYLGHVFFDESEDGPRPTQEEYDQARWG